MEEFAQVIPTDIKPSSSLAHYEICDVTQPDSIKSLLAKHKATSIIHLSAILSGAGEKDPRLARAVNIDGFMNVLEAAKEFGCQLVSPSTIAVFGPGSPRVKTPDFTVMRPSTIYGVSKVLMELMGEYYHRRFGVDFRSIRLPGVISPEPIHGFGTTGNPYVSKDQEMMLFRFCSGNVSGSPI